MRSPSRRADARRFRPEQPLRFSFEDEGHAGLEHCGPSPGLSAALAHALQIRVRRVLDDAQSKAFLIAHPADAWSALEVRSIMSDVEPFRLNLLKDAQSDLLYARLPCDPQVLASRGAPPSSSFGPLRSPANTASADFSLRSKAASPFQA
jgi:hypothetical protein